jgi:WD40 repeat protein
MCQSAPHIYISALPFAPTGSTIAQHYLPDFPDTFTFRTNKPVDWPISRTVLDGHTGPVYSARFSPDGMRIVSSSFEIYVWDAETGEMISGPFRYTGLAKSAAFLPNGKHIISAWDNETIHAIVIYDAETGEVISGPFRWNCVDIKSTVFSPDGRRIALLSKDKTIYVWNAETKAISGPFGGHNSNLKSVTFSHDGNRIVSGSWDQMLRVWDTETGEALSGPCKGHTSRIFFVAFSPNDDRVVSSSYDGSPGKVCLWDVKTGEMVWGPFKEQNEVTQCVAFSPDGRLIASSSSTGTGFTVRVWNAETGEAVSGPFEGHMFGITSIEFSPDGRRIVSSSFDQTIRIWDADMVVPGSYKPKSRSGLLAKVSPDDKRILLFENNVWVCWDLEKEEPVVFQGISRAESATFFPNSKHILSYSSEFTTGVWNAETGELVVGFEELIRATKFVNFNVCVTFSHDGQRFVSGCLDNTVRVWDAETGKGLSGPFEGHTGYISYVAFSPDDNCIVSGSWDMTICVWDTETGEKVLGPLRGHTQTIHLIVFSPNGKQIASSSRDKTIRVWNADTGDAVVTFRGHATNFAKSVTFSPNGKHIVSVCAFNFCVWDVETGEMVSNLLSRHIQDNFSTRETVSVLHNGMYIASAHQSDGTIRVWDLEKGEVVVGPFQGHSINSIAFSPNGKCLISHSTGSTVAHIWDIGVSETIKQLLDMMLK